MTRASSDYRSIFKGTSIFGGVQMIQVLVNLVRGKFVAMFLGPAGMGVNALFGSSQTTLTQLATCGMNLSVVQELASVKDGETAKAAATAGWTTVRMLALAGAMFTALFSGLLSKFTFGSYDYAWQFVLLAVSVYFSVLGQGRFALLQADRQTVRLAGASLIGPVVGLAVGVPLYYFFGTRGIVPAITVLSLSTYIFYEYQCRKAGCAVAARWEPKVHKPIARKLLSLGFTLMMTTLAGTASIYLLNVIIRNLGDTDSVGLYQAANSITNQYSGVVFAAMAVDYFPRLAAASSNRCAMRRTVNRQSEIVSLIIAPLVTLLILTAPLVIRILLTSEFEGVTPLMRWMGLGVLIKALSYPMGYMSFAKGDKALFFKLEGIWANILFLGCSVAGFGMFGLVGLGYAMVAENILYLISVRVVCGRVYGYRMSGAVRGTYLYAVVAASAVFAASMLPPVWDVAVMAAVTLITIITAVLQLRKLLRR